MTWTCHVCVLSTVSSNVLTAAACSSANSEDHGEAMRDPGKGVTSPPCRARPGFHFGAATLGLICRCDGARQGADPQPFWISDSEVTERLRAPKLLSCYHNNVAHPLQSRHSMPGVQCSAVALTTFTFILFLYHLLFGIEKEHSHWVFWRALPACPKTPEYKGMECPDGTVLHSYFEDLENKCTACAYAWTENTYKNNLAYLGVECHSCFFCILIIVSNRKYCWGFNSVVSP